MNSKKSVSFLFLCILLCGLLFSCQNRPKDVMGRKQMEQVMYDVYVAEATMENDHQNFDTPEKKEAYIYKVFKENKTSQARWDSSLSWYSDRIDLYLKMNDSVKSRLRRERQVVDALLALQNQSIFVDPSSLPASHIPSIYTFSMPYMGRGFRFRLDTAEISSKVNGDEFLFSFSAIGIPPHFSSPFTSLLTMTYGDTTIYQFQEIRENRTYELTGTKYIPGDTITGISGFVRLQDSTAMMPHIQLYNIYFGDKQLTVLETDSIMSAEGEELKELGNEEVKELGNEEVGKLKSAEGGKLKSAEVLKMRREEVEEIRSEEVEK